MFENEDSFVCVCVCMHLAQMLPLKQMWWDHGLPFTDHCSLVKSLAEEKLFLQLSRGANAPCKALLQTLAFLAHLATAACSASGVTPQGIWWTSKAVLQLPAGFFLPVTDAFLLSVESSTCICVCPVCYSHTWSSSSMGAPILRGVGLRPECMDIAASFSVLFFFSYFLFLFLSLSLKGLSHLMMGEQGKSFDFLFVSVTDHERVLSLLLFWTELCMTKATKPTGCQSSHLHFCLSVPWAVATCQPGTGCPRGSMKRFHGQ